MSEFPQTTDRTRQSYRRWVLPGALTAALLGASGLFWAWNAGRADRDALHLLEQAQPDTRRLGAWMAARERAPRALAEMARRLAAGTEQNPLVRESYVYALAHGTERGQLEVLERILRDDESPYVRQAAWRALARRAPGRFKNAAEAGTIYDDPWDEIGLGCGWLEIGDTRGVDKLLHWAANGSAEQRQVASLALSRGLAPLLEAAGRWPLEAEVQFEEPWPEKLVAEIQRRCDQLDLQAIADDTLRHEREAAQVRRNVGRLHTTRERIAWFLSAW